MSHSFGIRSRHATADGRGRWRVGRSAEIISNESIPSPPRGTLIESTTSEALLSDPAARIIKSKIQSSEYMASFSWLKSETPTAVIPGMAPRWAPLHEPRQLEEDSGTYFRDINSVHYPRHPLEPAVRALLAQAPDLTTDEIDVFACGSTMGNLLRFARRSDRPFQFIVESIGETVFLVRRENSPDETIPDVRGYGHSFPGTYTKLDECVREADSHQRMIKYDLAGFQCVVRYEVDGYLPQHAGSEVKHRDVQPLPQLENLKLLSGGGIIPQEAIFDLKTRSSRRQLTLNDVLDGELDRLWVRQIPNFVLAYHTRGLFEDVQVHDVRQQIHEWEQDHQSEIKILVTTLAKIAELARSRTGRRFEVCSDKPGVLDFREVGGEVASALPEDVTRLWSSKADDQPGSEGSDGGAELHDDSDTESGINIHSDDEDDFTACSAESCGYCGRCKY